MMTTALAMGSSDSTRRTWPVTVAVADGCCADSVGAMDRMNAVVAATERTLRAADILNMRTAPEGNRFRRTNGSLDLEQVGGRGARGKVIDDSRQDFGSIEAENDARRAEFRDAEIQQRSRRSQRTRPVTDRTVFGLGL